MNKLTTEERLRTVACLLEGNSPNTAFRMTGTLRKSIQILLRFTPAMAAGITDHVWNLEEIVNLLN
jgi:hypothetical protein